MKRIVENTKGFGGDGVQVIGKTGSVQRGKHVRAQREIVSISEVVWYLRCAELAASKKVAAVVAACAGSQSDEIELIHPAAIHSQQRGRPFMVNIVFVAVGCSAHWQYLAR